MEEKKITVSVDIELWKRLKVKAIEEDMNLKDLVGQILKEYFEA